MRDFRIRCAGLLLGALPCTVWAGAPAPGPNPILFVGAGPACDYATVQEAVDVASAAGGPDAIAIANDQTYAAQQIVVSDSNDLLIYGGFASCLSAPTGALTDLDGAGGAQAPVIRHTGGGDLELRNLRITGGDAVSEGGGVDSRGSGDLNLRNVVVSDNRGGSGGGINAYQDVEDGDEKYVRLIERVHITDNEAADGGGLVLIEGTLLGQDEAEVIVSRNRATAGDGGGMYLRNSTLETQDDETFGCTFTIVGNEAAMRGGGVFLQARGGKAYFLPKVRSDCAAAIVANEADVSGGGMHVQAQVDPIRSTQTEAGAVMFDTQLNDNRAPDGAAAMVRTATGSGPAPVAYFALVADTRGPRPVSRCNDPPVSVCPAMYRNHVATADGVTANGAVVAGIADSGAPVYLVANQAAFVDNIGEVFRVSGAQADLEVHDSLLTGSARTPSLLSADGDADVWIARSTIAHGAFSTAPGVPVMLGDRRFLLEGSIVFVHDRDLLRMRRADNTAVVRDVLAREQQLPPASWFAPTTSQRVYYTDDVRFVDYKGGDLRLARDSPAIDRARPTYFDGSPFPDLDHRPRGWDDPAVLNGPLDVYDLGAYEQADGVFRDGFE